MTSMIRQNSVVAIVVVLLLVCFGTAGYGVLTFVKRLSSKLSPTVRSEESLNIGSDLSGHDLRSDVHIGVLNDEVLIGGEDARHVHAGRGNGGNIHAARGNFGLEGPERG